MERLTETNNCIGFMKTYFNTDCNKCQFKGTEKCEEYKSECKAVSDFKRFTENMYSKLKEYEDLEEQGKLLRLPCSVGDTVYDIIPVDILNPHPKKLKIREYKNTDLVYIAKRFNDFWQNSFSYQRRSRSRIAENE